jgi:hypothetical protein
MKQFLSILFIVSLSALLYTCKKSTDNYTVDYQYEYFPLDSGRYWIYKVDSVTFQENIGDTVSFYVKEYIESYYPDNEGRPTARIERSRSNDTSFAWFITDIWFANRTQITGEKSEENLRFVKLLFPPEEGQTWKGNQYIQVTNSIEWMENWDYELQTLHTSATIGNMNFDSTLTVLQCDNENLFEKTFSTETYARNVGLVYKELMNLGKQDPAATWNEPKDGFILRMTIVDYGN